MASATTQQPQTNVTNSRPFAEIYADYWHWSSSPLTTALGYATLILTDEEFALSTIQRQTLQTLSTNCQKLRESWETIAQHDGFQGVTAPFLTFFNEHWDTTVKLAEQNMRLSYRLASRQFDKDYELSGSLPIIEASCRRVWSDCRHIANYKDYALLGKLIQFDDSVKLSALSESLGWFLPPKRAVELVTPNGMAYVNAGSWFTVMLANLLASHYAERAYAFRNSRTPIKSTDFQVNDQHPSRIEIVKASVDWLHITVHSNATIMLPPDTLPLLPSTFQAGNRYWLASQIIAQFDTEGLWHLSPNGCWFTFRMPASP